MVKPSDPQARAYQRVVWSIALGILLFAAAVVGWALAHHSRQMLKDGLDWGYDVALYGLAALVFGRGKAIERLAAIAVALVMLTAGIHTLYDMADKILDPRPIDPLALGFSAVSAIVVALLVVAALFRFRMSQNPLIAATWLSSRNDCFSTTLYSALGFAARALPTTRLPELALDAVAAALAFQAAGAIALQVLRSRSAESSALSQTPAAASATDTNA